MNNIQDYAKRKNISIVKAETYLGQNI